MSLKTRQLNALRDIGPGFCGAVYWFSKRRAGTTLEESLSCLLLAINTASEFVQKYKDDGLRPWLVVGYCYAEWIEQLKEFTPQMLGEGIPRHHFRRLGHIGEREIYLDNRRVSKETGYMRNSVARCKFTILNQLPPESRR